MDGEVRELADEISLDKKKKHSIDIVVDRLVVKPEIEQRLASSIETALKVGEGVLVLARERCFEFEIAPDRARWGAEIVAEGVKLIERLVRDHGLDVQCREAGYEP